MCTVADGRLEGVDNTMGPAGGEVPMVDARLAGFVGDGTVAMVKLATIDGVGSKASTVGLSATPSPLVAGVPGVAGATVVVVVVLILALVVGVGAMVVVVDVAGALVVVEVVVVVGGRIGKDSAWLRVGSLPAHCVVPSGTAATSRVLSTSRAVRLVGSRSDCGDSGVPPTVTVERCTANGPTGQSSICGRERTYVEVGCDHNSCSDPSRWDPLESTCRHASLSIL